MIVTRWLLGLIRRRPVELAGAAAACAITCAFLACLGTFIGQSRAHMTERALASLPVAWQVQATPGASLAGLQSAAARLPHVRAAQSVQYAAVPGFDSTINGTTRATGKAFVVALAPTYGQEFPGTVRPLVGSTQGAQLLQQTAANLALTPGGIAVVHTATGKRIPVRVSGMSEMPSADSFFQVVGAAPGAGATAPPDNVLLVPPAMFAQLADGAQVVRQVHVAFDKRWLPADPGRAFTAE
ncbi:MAG: putative transport system permease protein, partial [Frankiaceae bacterium]|nr:putative transport system permease protein [Frankiaceae bacterium]